MENIRKPHDDCPVIVAIDRLIATARAERKAHLAIAQRLERLNMPIPRRDKEMSK